MSFPSSAIVTVEVPDASAIGGAVAGGVVATFVIIILLVLVVWIVRYCCKKMKVNTE